MMETITYSPLNLFTNFQEAAANFSETPIIFDEPLSAFPELGLETTYKMLRKCVETGLSIGSSWSEIRRQSYYL